jgi:hypothetical protein
VENQHRQITGYRDLTQEEIDLMNEIKELGRALGEMVTEVRNFAEADQRWASIGATHLQEGLMALTRAIARPTSF